MQLMSYPHYGGYDRYDPRMFRSDNFGYSGPGPQMEPVRNETALFMTSQSMGRDRDRDGDRDRDRGTLKQYEDVPPNLKQNRPDYLPDHSCFACFTMVYCCVPLGLWSLAYVFYSWILQASGHIADAKRYARKAKKTAIIALVLGIVLHVIVILSVVLTLTYGIPALIIMLASRFLALIPALIPKN